MEKELYEHLLVSKKLMNRSTWMCSSCTGAHSELERKITEVNTRVRAAEFNIQINQETISKHDSMFTAIEKRLEKLEAAAKDQGDGGGGHVMMEEIAERASRERNLLIHCWEESTEPGENLNLLFHELRSELDSIADLITTRRLGKVRQNGPRPLLIVLKNKAARDELLGKAPKLAKSSDPKFKKVSIKADLTERQRKLEKGLGARARELNMSLTQDQVQKNGVWKVLGKRGERLLRRLPLREGESLSEDGSVSWQVRSRQSKRGWSPGADQSLTRSPTNRSPPQKTPRPSTPTPPPASSPIPGGSSTAPALQDELPPATVSNKSPAVTTPSSVALLGPGVAENKE